MAPFVVDSPGGERGAHADALTEQHRDVVVAAYYEGRAVAEIATRLDLPVGTVKSRLHYALRNLRLALQEKGVVRP